MSVNEVVFFICKRKWILVTVTLALISRGKKLVIYSTCLSIFTQRKQCTFSSRPTSDHGREKNQFKVYLTVIYNWNEAAWIRIWIMRNWIRRKMINQKLPYFVKFVNSSGLRGRKLTMCVYVWKCSILKQRSCSHHKFVS